MASFTEAQIATELDSWDLAFIGDQWQTAVDSEPALSNRPAGRGSQVFRPLVAVVASSLEIPQDVLEASDPLLDAALFDLMADVGSAGVAVRQLMCLGQVLDLHCQKVAPLSMQTELVRRILRLSARLMTQASSIGLAAVNKLSFTDGDTNLFNKRAFSRDVAALFAQGRSFGFIYMDLDGLKRVNDSQGHLAGDQLIGSMAVAVSAVAQPGESAYRWGGDEYGLLMPEASTTRVSQALQDLLGSAPKFSYGVVMSPTHADTLQELMDLGDAGIQRVKAQHRRDKGLTYVGMERAVRLLKELQLGIERAHDGVPSPTLLGRVGEVIVATERLPRAMGHLGGE